MSKTSKSLVRVSLQSDGYTAIEDGTGGTVEQKTQPGT